MVRFIYIRFGQALVSLAFVAVLVFLLSRITGDPVRLMLPPEATLAARAALRHALGLDQPVSTQFVRFVASTATGDLGRSYTYNEPVRDLLLRLLPNSLLL